MSKIDMLMRQLPFDERDILERAATVLDEACADARKLGTRAAVQAYDRAKREYDQLVNDNYDRCFPAGRRIKTVQDIAEYLKIRGWKVAARTLYQHKKDELFTARADGNYYIDDIEEYAKINLVRENGSDGSISEKKASTDIRLKEIKAELEQTRLDKMRGELISREAVEDEFAARVYEFRTGLMHLVDSLPVQVVGLDAGQVRAVLDQHFRHLLSQYSRTLEVLRDADS